MKRALLILPAVLIYYLLNVDSVPAGSNGAAAAFAPQQASLLSQLPGMRAQPSAPSSFQAINVAEALPTETADGDSKRVADEHVEAHREEWGIQAHHDLRFENTYPGPLGTVVKYNVYQGELQLTGMDVEVRVAQDRIVKDVSVHYTPTKEIDVTTPVMSVDEIADSVSDRFEQVPGQAGGTQMIFTPSAPNSQPVVAFAMTVRRKGAEASEPVQAIFRASDGQILDLTVARGEMR